MASAPLVPNEAPPAYTGPPAGFKYDGQGAPPAGYQGGPPAGYQGGAPAGYGGPPGYPAGQQPSYMAGQAHERVVVVQQSPVLLVGGCPACRVGVLEDDFSCVGVLCAILFFPLGILCCLAMRQRRCPNCGAVFG